MTAVNAAADEASGAATTVGAAVAAATETLHAAGVDSPRHDARALAEHVLGVARGQLDVTRPLSPDARGAYGGLIARRAAREPLQHLLGRVGFRYLDLEVGPGVFVPRPETESVVQWAIDALAREDVAAPVVVDLCSGSGAVALSIASEVPGARVHAVERDPAAADWLLRNVARCAAGGERVSVHVADAATALPDLDGHCDVVVSNPPYVAVTERDLVDPEVRDHDPAIALWAGEDGLDLVRVVAQTAHRLLRPGGLLVIEHSDRHGTSAPELLRRAGGWVEVADHRDLAGRDRFVTARRRPVA